MDFAIEKIPGGFNVDGLALRNGKCGCTAALPCCCSRSKVRNCLNKQADVRDITALRAMVKTFFSAILFPIGSESIYQRRR